ncbi:MAG: sialidase family protein [Actinomycetota bacterium]
MAVSALAGALLMAPVSAQQVTANDTEVTVGSRDNVFSQNKQNEPGLAVDPTNTDTLVAGANDNIDMEACNAFNPGEDPLGSQCPFTPGVGLTGFQISFDRGESWIQPEYTGYSARNGEGNSCNPPTPTTEPCVPEDDGPIGTPPHYRENSLVSNGDPILAFGPKPLPDGSFSYENGARLYFSNIATNFPGEEGFQGSGAIAVSRTDDLAGAAAGDNDAWMDPVIVTKQNEALFSDKEVVWADNAESSEFFGNVYVCNVGFRGAGGAEPVLFARSTDGGDTWDTRQVTQAANTGSGEGRSGGRQGCTIRTDSTGVVYLFFTGSFKGESVQYLARSFDGGNKFERPRPVVTITEVGRLDPVQGRFTFDGFAGSRTNSFPSVDIANGAPMGEDATDAIVLTWPDARNGLNNEEALVVFSTDGGDSFSEPVNAAAGTDAENGAVRSGDDRPDFPAVAISPNGTDVYLTYNGFLDPYRETTDTPRRYQGVVRHADFSSDSGFGVFTTLNRGEVGDARGSSANGLAFEFTGDYNYAVATRDYGAAIWVDDRTSSVCEAINEYRQSLIDGAPTERPVVQEECPPTFGGTSNFAGSYDDPTP